MEAEGEAAARRLYGLSVTVWSTTEETFVSAYLASISGLVCGILMMTQWHGKFGSLFALRWQITLVALFQFVGFGLSAIAFHMIEQLDDANKLVGASLFGQNSQWIWLWFPAAVVKPLCSACALGGAITYTGQAGVWETQSANAVGCLASFYSFYLVLTDQVLNSATPDIYWAFLAWGVATALLAYYGRGKAGFTWLLAGYLLRTGSLSILCFFPCNIGFDLEDARDGCAYPQDTVHNLVFHMLVALSLPPLYYGAKQKHEQDCEYEDLLEKRAAEKEAHFKESQQRQESCTWKSCGGGGCQKPGCTSCTHYFPGWSHD